MNSDRLVVPVHIVEDHDEALPLIHRAIATKQLPFNSIALIHFDAHPDLLSPNIKADDLTDKDELYAHTSIADWILPAVYMGHFSSVVWLKPPWANQIPNGTHSLTVGKDKTTRHIRLATPLPYFISELLYVPESELENSRTIPLLVVTVDPHTADPIHTSVNTEHATNMSSMSSACVSSSTLSPRATNLLKRNRCSLGSAPPSIEEALEPPLSKQPKLDTMDITQTRHCNKSVVSPKQGFISQTIDDIRAVIGDCDAWVLDVDMDFYSTGNPYRGPFTETQYDLLKSLYRVPCIQDPNDEQVMDFIQATVFLVYQHEYMSIIRCVQERREQLELLQGVWSTGALDQVIIDKIQITSHDIELLKGIKSFLGSTHNHALVDGDYIHVAGMLTDLPVHLSTTEEINDLMQASISLLESTRRCTHCPQAPSMITIARSSIDDYTPPDQVELIQETVLRSLEQLFASDKSAKFNVRYNYLDKHEEYLYDSPSNVCDCSYL